MFQGFWWTKRLQYALSSNLHHSHSKFCVSLSLTLGPFPYDFPQALGAECKSRQNSFSSTIHLSTGLLGRKKEERERVSINHLTPGYIYAHSNEFNKESSPWSKILSGTSSLSPSSTPQPPSPRLTPPPPHPHPSGGFWLWSGRRCFSYSTQTERRWT